VGEVRRYSAHLARDAFVCGNGYHEMRQPPSVLRLLRPETVAVRADGQFIVNDPVTGLTESIEGPHVLHLRGMHQTRGLVGMSVLEPLVILQAQLEVAQAAVAEGVPMALRTGTEEARDWAERTRAFAARIENAYETRTTELLGGGTAGLGPPPANLYFPGRADMEPASPRLRFVDGADTS
jgi:hypothetical protein